MNTIAQYIKTPYIPDTVVFKYQLNGKLYAQRWDSSVNILEELSYLRKIGAKHISYQKYL